MHDVEAPPAARAALRIRRVGDALQLLQDEHRDHQLAIDEAGRDEIADAPVDDRRGVDEHRERAGLLTLGAARAPRLAGGLARLPALGAILVAAEAAEAQDRAMAAGADDGEQVPEHERQRQEQVAAHVRQRPDGERRQRGRSEAEHEPYATDDQLAGGTRLCCSFDPPDRPYYEAADDVSDDQSPKCADCDCDRPAGPRRRRQKMKGKAPWTGRDLATCECSQEGEDQPHDQLHGLRSLSTARVGRSRDLPPRPGAAYRVPFGETSPPKRQMALVTSAI